jgi:hypothetical protein
LRDDNSYQQGGHALKDPAVSPNCKKRVVIFTSLALLLKAVSSTLIWLFHLEHSAFAGTVSGVTDIAALALVFGAWSLVVKAGLGWKWRILILAFGPFAALMLPTDSKVQ